MRRPTALVVPLLGGRLGLFAGSRGGGNPQLRVTGAGRSGDQIHTYSSLYLRSQPPGENNHTPAWDCFKIPDEPPQ